MFPMPDRTRKNKPARRKPADEDENVVAHRIVDEATEDEEPTDEERSAAARLLGRRGGLKGGPARAKKLSPSRRKAIARKAATARWKKQKTQPE